MKGDNGEASMTAQQLGERNFAKAAICEKVISLAKELGAELLELDRLTPDNEKWNLEITLAIRDLKSILGQGWWVRAS